MDGLLRRRLATAPSDDDWCGPAQSLQRPAQLRLEDDRDRHQDHRQRIAHDPTERGEPAGRKDKDQRNHQDAAQQRYRLGALKETKQPIKDERHQEDINQARPSKLGDDCADFRHSALNQADKLFQHPLPLKTQICLCPFSERQRLRQTKQPTTRASHRPRCRVASAPAKSRA